MNIGILVEMVNKLIHQEILIHFIGPKTQLERVAINFLVVSIGYYYTYIGFSN